MKRKFLKTSLVIILLLLSFLLTSCGESYEPLTHLSWKDKKISYSVEETYFVTLKYGHSSGSRDEDKDKFVGYFTCAGYGEEADTSTDIAILLKLESFLKAENAVEKKYIRLGNLYSWTIYNYNQEVTLEIPKSHIVGEKGYLLLGLLIRPAEGEIAPLNNYSMSGLCKLHYEVKDGRIYFEFEKVN